MITIVVPSVGRPSLDDLLAALAPQVGDGFEVVVVDDRRCAGGPLAVPDWVRVVPGRAAGPAAARNDGWRTARGPWVAFLDDDVRPDPDWARRLADDLDVPYEVGGVQGRVRVPLPADRPATDWERSTAGLADGRWITADMAYRRTALEAVGGFDERFPRAFREDVELAARVRAAGWDLMRGGRWVTHPVRPESRWVSVRTQRGNADDALLRRLYGPRWRDHLEVPRGRRPRHLAIAAAGVLVVGLADTGHRQAAALAAAVWAAGTAEFAWARIGPGPRTPGEVATMLATSAAIPPLAAFHWLRGWVSSRHAHTWPKRSR